MVEHMGSVQGTAWSPKLRHVGFCNQRPTGSGALDHCGLQTPQLKVIKIQIRIIQWCKTTMRVKTETRLRLKKIVLWCSVSGEIVINILKANVIYGETLQEPAATSE